MANYSAFKRNFTIRTLSYFNEKPSQCKNTTNGPFSVKSHQHYAKINIFRLLYIC